MLSEAKRAEVLGILKETYPDAKPALHFSSPFELLVATMLSAQCTDKQVNKCTDVLFPKYNTPEAFAAMDFDTLEPYIRSCGFYRMKGEHILEMSRILLEKYGGRVPETREELTSLPGVGRKTANVVLSNAFRIPAIAVDTHVFRVANRIGLTRNSKNVLETEKTLVAHLPQAVISKAHHWLILHGRYVCLARKPKCAECGITAFCDYYQKKNKA